MKIKCSRKQAAIIILLVIAVPIIYNKVFGIVAGAIQKRAMMMPKGVVVDNPGEEEISVSAEATGRVEAKHSVDVIVRVPGFLIKKFFKEGDFVKKGQTIFQIDPREYQLQVNNSLATVNQYSALLKNTQQELDRANALVKEDLISRSDVDSSLASRNQNKALLDAARQQLELARVNLSYTNIKSPIDGRIGKVNITEGNYVTATSGSLVNISSTNPVYVAFSLKSSDFVKLLRASEHQLKDVEVKIQFDGGKWYDKIGSIDFVDNQIDKNSGSIALRAVFDNTKAYDVNFNDLIETAKASRPALLAAKKQMDAAELNVRSAKRAFTPDFNIFGSYDRGGPQMNTDYGYQFGGQLTYSNLNLMLLKKQIDEAKATYKKYVADYEQQKQNVYLEVKSAFISLMNSKDSLEVSKLALQQAKEQQYQAFRRYQVGLGNAIEFKDAENTYLNAQLSYYSNLLDYNVNAAELERVVGAPIKETDVDL